MERNRIIILVTYLVILKTIFQKVIGNLKSMIKTTKRPLINN